MKYFVFALAFVFFEFSSELAFAQNKIIDTTQIQNNYGSISGKVIDAQGKPLDFAAVKVIKEGKVIIGSYTNEDGSYKINNLPAEIYDIDVSYSGLKTKRMSKVKISKNKKSIRNFVIERDKECKLQGLLIINNPVIDEQSPGKDKYDKDQIRTILGGQ